MAPTQLLTDTARRLRVLIVDDEADLLDLIGDVVRRQRDCRLLLAHNLGEAQQILATQTIDLLVTDVHLPDGDGTTLLPMLREKCPHAGAIVITGSPTIDKAITALRHGCDDFLLKPFTADDLALRVSKALRQHQTAVKVDKRLTRLRSAVRKLNDARRQVTRKVDLLCNDLISAYGDLSKQFESVRAQEAFRNFIGESKDLEQMLCNAMDYLMRQMGYANIAIWLAGDDKHFELGAYMKYTIAGETAITRAMKNGIVQLASQDAFLHLRGEELTQALSPAELEHLADQDLLAVNCTYLGQTLAVIVMFRESAKEFTEADAACLKAVSPIFAVTLASMVRVDPESDDNDFGDYGPLSDDIESSGETETDGDADPGSDKPRRRRDESDSDGDLQDEDRPRRRRRKPDPSDWWKRGEPPPF